MENKITLLFTKFIFTLFSICCVVTAYSQEVKSFKVDDFEHKTKIEGKLVEGLFIKNQCSIHVYDSIVMLNPHCS